MYNSFRGIPFSQEDEITCTHANVVIASKETKENIACCFHSFLQVFERGLMQKISHFDGKELPIKAG